MSAGTDRYATDTSSNSSISRPLTALPMQSQDSARSSADRIHLGGIPLEIELAGLGNREFAPLDAMLPLAPKSAERRPPALPLRAEQSEDAPPRFVVLDIVLQRLDEPDSGGLLHILIAIQ